MLSVHKSDMFKKPKTVPIKQVLVCESNYWGNCWKKTLRLEKIVSIGRPLQPASILGGAKPQKWTFWTLPPHKTPFLAHFMAKSGPFGPNPPHKTPDWTELNGFHDPTLRFRKIVWYFRHMPIIKIIRIVLPSKINDPCIPLTVPCRVLALQQY